MVVFVNRFEIQFYKKLTLRPLLNTEKTPHVWPFTVTSTAAWFRTNNSMITIYVQISATVTVNVLLKLLFKNNRMSNKIYVRLKELTLHVGDLKHENEVVIHRT